MTRPEATVPAVVRVLAVDDDPGVRDAYRQILGQPAAAQNPGGSLADARRRLFGTRAAPTAEQVFELDLCADAQAAVDAVAAAQRECRPYAAVFLDMRMPPGHDGLWAAQRIRETDPRLDIVIATAYSDIAPEALAAQVPPHGNLFYLQKPFHPHEVRQLAVALGRKRHAEDAMRRIAYYDSVTGLPNRVYFQQHLRGALDLATRHDRKLALLFIDLDNFKQVNDTLGHAAGDVLLNEVARRLSANVRVSDDIGRTGEQGPQGELARLGGDEFTVLLSEIACNEDAGRVASRLMGVLTHPVAIAGHSLVVSASIGIAVFPEDGTDIDTLMKNADLAMYFAKRDGRNLYRYYTAEMNESALRRMTLEKGLRSALANGELSLQYQPLVKVGSQQVCGVEALLRWQNAELGVIAPHDFIPIAEETGLIVPIGEWVLRTACRQGRRWQDSRADGPVRIAVNVSARQFMQRDFVARVREILADTGLGADLLELEITESVLMKDSETSLAVLHELRALGVRLAIDDFGTGYSSLAYLRKFPINRLKIDRSFISSLMQDATQGSIAASIIALAASLGLDVTAEGVEAEDQLQFLRTHVCDEFQGHLFSAAVSDEQIARYLDPD
ncbi:MAG: putative bifunctional diguanylate cyclase/phosphodiesterase [Gammaproteobacteria bacterium]